MDQGVELSVQPQVWINDRATDAGTPFVGDVREVLLSMNAADFSETAQEIFAGRSGLETLVMKSGLAASWLTGARDRTYHAAVFYADFEEWLESRGFDRDRAVQMTDGDMDALRSASAATMRRI